jgi:hypothetical protein
LYLAAISTALFSLVIICAEAVLHGPDGDLGAGAEIEFGHDVLDVIGGGLLGDLEFPGDRAIRETASD